MIWKKITIETLTSASDVVASVLFDNGIVGAEIEDNLNLTDDELKKMYVDIPINKVDDGIAKVSFFVTEVANKEKNNFENYVGVNDTVDNSYKQSTDNFFTKEELNNIIVNIKNDLESYRNFMDMGTLKFSETELDDNIFLNKWKENFKPILLDNINIIPSFDKEKYKNDNSKINIFIEPGNAFGTGQHETTILCLETLINIIKNTDNKNINVLDIGCGSGILGIASIKLGAKKITTIDIDSEIENNLKENFNLNNITYDNDDAIADYAFGNIIDDTKIQKFVKNKALNGENYDIVIANILSPVICSLLLSGHVDEYVKKGGYFVCSGIISEKKADVLNAFTENGKFCDINAKNSGDWHCIFAKKS